MSDCKACAKRLKAQRKGIQVWRKQRETVKRMRDRGLDADEIAASMKMPRWQIDRLMPRVYPEGYVRPRRPRSMTHERLEEMLRDGMKPRAIALELDCHVSTVYRYWKELLEQEKKQDGHSE